VPSEQAIQEQLRSAPRYSVVAPAALVAEGPGAAEEAAELGEELALDGPEGAVAEDVSQGGAFVRTAQPFAVGARLRVAIALPTGDLLLAPAEVAAVARGGVGLRWTADAAGRAEIAEMVARVAAQKPRVLVVDDDALVRQMISDALSQRGFEVLLAHDGGTALAVLSEEILTLDLLIADLWMPHMDGEALLRTVRRAGGERDLAIVLVSGKIEVGMEAKLEREGADAVLSKALGPQVIAQAATAVLERKRQAAR
jgi:CheY-like chemotaxis protein